MQASDPVLIGGVPLDAFFAFLLALIGLLFFGNLAYMLLRQVLDGRVSPPGRPSGRRLSCSMPSSSAGSTRAPGTSSPST